MLQVNAASKRCKYLQALISSEPGDTIMQKHLSKAFVTLALSAAIALPTLSQTAQAAPRRGGDKSATGNRPAPKPGGREIKMLETALGRALTAAEIAAVTAAATAQKTANDGADSKFQSAVTNLFALNSSQSVAVAQQGCHSNSGDILNVLATALGRELTDDEIVQANALQATHDAALRAAMADFETAVAAAVGLSVDELGAKIQAARPADGGGRGGPGGGPGRGRR